jgi:hypothetical protein
MALAAAGVRVVGRWTRGSRDVGEEARRYADELAFLHGYPASFEPPAITVCECGERLETAGEHGQGRCAYCQAAARARWDVAVARRKAAGR